MAPSLSTIVTVAVAVPSVAPLGVESVTVKVSVGSVVRSPTISTWKAAVVDPTANVTVPVFETKSEPALAVPATVVTITVTADEEACDSVSGISTVLVFLSPSVTVALPIETIGSAAGLRIVTVPVSRATWRLPAFVTCTLNVLFGCPFPLPLTNSVTCWDELPAVNVTDPDAAS